MPSKSGAQHRFMELIAHGGKARSGHGPSVKVAKEFVRADARKKSRKRG
jgi:cellobiose-specific phosphotransferase system component IIA